MDFLNALSVVDGRYGKRVDELREIFSEYGLIKHRLFVEIEWLKFIVKELNFAEVSDEELALISAVYDGFNQESAAMVKQIEAETNHDVKSVEYYIKNQLENRGLGNLKEWTHFCCTSEDINNASYALMIKSGKKTLASLIREILNKIETLAYENRAVPMTSRTHGQPATPTTVGKEFINFAARISRELQLLEKIEPECKFNGAVGNFNAHFFAKPEIDWIAASEKFITNHLRLKPLFWTTQINNYHYIAEIFHTLIRICSTIIDFDRDVWTYISFGYFKQKLKAGEVGSSTMPHKVNPIDFENSEGNSGVAISLMEHLSVKLLNSRMQRDLTDSTVLRNIGSIFGYILISGKSCLRGLDKIEIDRKKIAAELAGNLELLAEPIQTAMRVYGESEPYERLKRLTRGREIKREDLDDFIDSLEKTPSEIKIKLKRLLPATYLGCAEKLVEKYFVEKGGNPRRPASPFKD